MVPTVHTGAARALRPGWAVRRQRPSAIAARPPGLRSQSRRGDCYDIAQAESLWSRLKTEVLEVRERPLFADLADAQRSVADYFDYDNHERLHSSIDYQTPFTLINSFSNLMP